METEPVLEYKVGVVLERLKFRMSCSFEIYKSNKKCPFDNKEYGCCKESVVNMELSHGGKEELMFCSAYAYRKVISSSLKGFN